MKVIVILREPVSRLHSAFWYYGCMHGIYKHLGMHADGFHKFANGEVSRLQECMATGSGMRECVRTHFNASTQVIKGMYAAAVPDWLAVYPADQIMWIKAEDYYGNERAYLQV